MLQFVLNTFYCRLTSNYKRVKSQVLTTKNDLLVINFTLYKYFKIDIKLGNRLDFGINMCKKRVIRQI